MGPDWQSYDSAAGGHDRIAASNIFEPPARELVARINLQRAAAILDVGTGTGIAARVALESSPPAALVIGLDPSLEMLRFARSRGLRHVAGGSVPGLPFAGGSFDAILANFVLSHVSDYAAALRDLARTLRPGGRLGATAWAGLENEYRQCWQAIADSFAGQEALQSAVRQALPWEEWFTEAAHLRQAFADAGLGGIEMHRTRHTAPLRIADFLEMRETSLQARFIRHRLEPRAWQEFKQTLAAEFYRKYKDPIDHTRDVHIAIGTRL